MEVENRNQLEGTYIFHFEGETEFNHVLHLRNNFTFTQRCFSMDKKQNLNNFMRIGKYKIDGNKIDLMVDFHQKLDEEDKSKSSKDEQFTIILNKIGDLESVPGIENQKETFLKIFTISEPKKTENLQSLVDFFIEKL
jgi:hypothetical protein